MPGLHGSVQIHGTVLVEKDLFAFVFVTFMNERGYLNLAPGFFSQPTNDLGHMTWQGKFGIYELVESATEKGKAMRYI